MNYRVNNSTMAFCRPLLFLLTFLGCTLTYNTFAQSSDPNAYVCYGLTRNDTPALKSAVPPALPCQPSSVQFLNYYSAKENYIPQNGITTPLTVGKTIKVIIHVMQHSASDTLNYHASDEPMIRQIIDSVNYSLAHVMAPSDPVTAFCNACHVYDSRLRVQLVGIRYHISNLTWEDVYGGNGTGGSSTNNLVPYFEGQDYALNVFMTYSQFGNVAGGITTNMPHNNQYQMVGQYPNRDELFFGNNNGTPFITVKNYYKAPNYRWNARLCANNLLHEIGHALGMFHVYDDGAYGNNELCDESQYDFLRDCFSSGANKICNRPPFGVSCNDPYVSNNDNCTNNIMGGNPWGTYLSPQQLGRIHRNAYFLSCRKFMYNTMPEDANHDHTGEGQNYPLMISKSETWDFDVKMYNDIVVKSGAALTLRCRVMMPYMSNIIVEPGAMLVVDGGRITGDHDSTWWYGITVLGDKSKHQFTDYNAPSSLHTWQGNVFVVNGATIEQARHAVILGDGVYGDAGKAGGMVYAKDATFKNNMTSLHVWEYHNYDPNNPSILANNRSLAANCNFIVDKTLPKTPGAQVTMWNVDGIHLWGNNFANKQPYVAGIDRGMAVGSSGSSFTVMDYCPGMLTNNTAGCGQPIIRSHIQGWRDGVNATNIAMVNSFTVKNSDFEGNINGVWVSGVNAFKVIHNTFKIGDSVVGFTTSNPHGVYIEGATNYSVYDNQFAPYVPPGYWPSGYNNTRGTEVYESGSDNNLIRSNKYSQLTIGNLSSGNNTNGLFPNQTQDQFVKGLEFKCNTYDPNFGTSEFVYGGDSTSDGMRTRQGSNAQPVGNTFPQFLFGNTAIYMQELVNWNNGSHYNMVLPLQAVYYYNGNAMYNPVNVQPPSRVNKVPSPNYSGYCDTLPKDDESVDGNKPGFRELYQDTSADRNWRLDSMLAAQHSAYADIDRALLAINTGNISKGMEIYGTILRNYPDLLPKERNEFTQGAALIQLIADYAQAGKSLTQLSPEDAVVVRSVRDKAYMWAHSRACNWLELALGEKCDRNGAQITTTNGAQPRSISGTYITGTNDNIFVVHPNPSTSVFNIDYRLVNAQDATITVTDITGRVICIMSLNGKMNTCQINAANWTNAVYLYKVVQGKAVLATGRLVKY